MKPTAPTTPYSSAIAQALANDAANAPTAQGAPQQAVVNGWVARDLLTVIAYEGASSSSTDDRPAALLVIAVVGIALVLITGGVADGSGTEPGSPRNSVDAAAVPDESEIDPAVYSPAHGA